MLKNNKLAVLHDFSTLRADFPILHQTNRGKPLIYLDSSASSQKPQQVIDALAQYYAHEHANIHRGVYELSEQATKKYEAVRERIKNFIHAEHAHEIIFTSGTTEGINLVAQSFGRSQLNPGDEILITTMEHHSNIVPWQLICEERGAIIRVVPISDEGELDLDALLQLLSPRTKLLALTHASNVLGTINPLEKIIKLAHAQGIPVLVDGAQAFPHLPIDVQQLDCDFYVFSSHKAYGPTGVGVLYGKTELLEKMPPYQGGGDMIETVSFERSVYAKLPGKFEAGTPHIAGVIGFGEAIHYLQRTSMEAISAHEHALLQYALNKLADIPGLRLIGTAPQKVGVISFVLENIHPHDIGTVLDHEGIAIRAGHHCAMPLMQRYQVPATVRASFGLYNNEQDIDALIAAIHLTQKVFAS